MKTLARMGLATMALALGSIGTASACSLAAWTTTSGSPITGGPTTTPVVPKYAGLCGMQAANAGTSSYVEESASHNAEGGAAPLRVRFFVYTGISGANPVVFRALDSGGASVIDVAYNSSLQSFAFTVNSVTRTTADNSAPRNRWIRVELLYQASAAVTASTRALDVVTPAASGLVAGTATVEAVRLGIVAGGGGSGTVSFDEYEASRSSTPPSTGAFAMRCRGDTDNNGSYELPDIFGVIDEFLRGQGDGTRSLAAGQADYDEDGSVALVDIFGVVDRFLAVQAGAPGSACIP